MVWMTRQITSFRLKLRRDDHEESLDEDHLKKLILMMGIL